jgi:hypothetical protein
LGKETYLSYEPGEKIYAPSGVVKDEVVIEGGLLAGSYLGYEPGEKIYAPSGVVKDEVVIEGGLLAGSYLSYEPGEKIYAPSGVVKDEVVTEGGVVDDVLVADQREVARRVIEEGVRASMEWMGNIVRVIEGLKGGEGVGGVQKVVMSGGDAFSKVPLFPEDMGLVMMMLGLV